MSEPTSPAPAARAAPTDPDFERLVKNYGACEAICGGPTPSPQAEAARAALLDAIGSLARERDEALASAARLRERVGALAQEWEDEAQRRDRQAVESTWSQDTLRLGASFERNHAERLRAALRAESPQEKQQTCAASAPGVPLPTKGVDAGGDALDRDAVLEEAAYEIDCREEACGGTCLPAKYARRIRALKSGPSPSNEHCPHYYGDDGPRRLFCRLPPGHSGDHVYPDPCGVCRHPIAKHYASNGVHKGCACGCMQDPRSPATPTPTTPPRKVIEALATLLRAANDLAPEDDPDKYDHWRALVVSARLEYDALRRAAASPEAKPVHMLDLRHAAATACGDVGPTSGIASQVTCPACRAEAKPPATTRPTKHEPYALPFACTCGAHHWSGISCGTVSRSYPDGYHGLDGGLHFIDGRTCQPAAPAPADPATSEETKP